MTYPDATAYDIVFLAVTATHTVGYNYV